MATKRWNSNKVKMNGLGGNAASVDDIKDAGLWGTVQDTPLVKGADGKTYAEMPAGWSNVNGNYSQVDSIQGDGAPSAIERSVQNVRQTLGAEGQSTFDQMRTEGQDPSAAVEYTERFVDA